MGDIRPISHCDQREPAPGSDICSRALLLWPRLDRRKLARARGDADRVARIVGRRTSLPHEAIVKLLEGRSQS